MTVTADVNIDPVRFAAVTIREVITCERAECGSWTHTRFVEDNLDRAREAVNNSGGAA